jgi:hypothetical protein
MKSKAEKDGNAFHAHLDVPKDLPAGSALWVELELEGQPSATIDFPLSPASTSAPAPSSAQTYTVANVTLTLPAGWTLEKGSNPMRLAELHTNGDVNCIAAVSTAGGTVEANLERWKGQILDDAARPVTPKVETLTINGSTVTVMSASGVYRGMGTTPPEKDTTLLGAIIPSPAPNTPNTQLLFLKMTGPTKAVESVRPAFMTLVNSLKPASPTPTP